MAKRQSKNSSNEKTTKNGEIAVSPNSTPIADRGIVTTQDMGMFMSALIGDLATGRQTPKVGNAMCSAASKMIKIVEMNHQYGRRDGGRLATLDLIPQGPAHEDDELRKRALAKLTPEEKTVLALK